MVKDGEDLNGLQTTKLKNRGGTFQHPQTVRYVFFYRHWVTWKNSVTWIVTLKGQPKDGRSLWKASVLRKRNSLRSGRTRALYRNYA